jgi:general stress protein 26
MSIHERIFQTLPKQEPFLCALATVDRQGRPSVRYVRCTIDDGLTFRCPTFIQTRKIQHVRSHPDVSLTCGATDSTAPGTYLQIEGTAEVSLEEADRRAAWSGFLEKWFSGMDDPNFAVVVITPSRILALPIGGGPAAEVWER